MNDIYVVKGETLTDIADAIREKSRDETSISCDDFANRIRNISPELQNKEVTITQDGITDLTCDSGYDGLSTVRINTNTSEAPFEYVQDGLIAWFDVSSPFDSNEHWNNLVGNDYIYVYSRPYGTQQRTRYFKDNPINFNGYCFKTSAEYYKTGNTIEVVGMAGNWTSNNTVGSWLITGDITGTAGIGMNDVKNDDIGYLQFINWGDGAYRVEMPFFKLFGASVYYDDIIERDNIRTGSVTVSASYNGGPWRDNIVSGNETGVSSRGAGLNILSYYNNAYKSFGEVKCIRIYNRKLTNEEIAYNHAIDKARFHLEN